MIVAGGHDKIAAITALLLIAGVCRVEYDLYGITPTSIPAKTRRL